MATHKIKVTKPGQELEAVCLLHATNFPNDEDDTVAEFAIYRDALAAGWRRVQRQFVCPLCAKKAGAV